MRAPAPVEIVEGVAFADSLSVLAAESGAGKTYMLLNMAAHVSDGLPWHGRQVLAGSVVYVSFEGDALGLRLRALSDVAGHRLDHLHVIRATDPLSPRITRDGEECSLGEFALSTELATLTHDIAAAGEPPIRLGVIDTVRASMTGSEDSSEHVSAYLRVIRRLMARTPGAAWLLSHHAGWQDGEQQRKRERGSSAWRGNCDATLYLEADDYDATKGEARLTLRALKVRDGERPAPLHLVRRRVELLERDRHGDPVTSCVIERDQRTRQDREAEQAQATEAETRATDLQVLRVMRDHRITSQAALRAYVGLQRDLVVASVSRILRAGWVREPERQRQPYELTAAGHTALLEQP